MLVASLFGIILAERLPNQSQGPERIGRSHQILFESELRMHPKRDGEELGLHASDIGAAVVRP